MEAPLFLAMDSMLENSNQSHVMVTDKAREYARRDDLLCSLSGVVSFQHSITITPRRGSVSNRPGGQASSKRRPRDSTHSKILERREHLALLFAVDDVVVVLHRDEGCEVVVDGIVLHRVD
jgi:hypothetical protein